MLTIHGSISLFFKLVGMFDSSCASINPRLSNKTGAKIIRIIEPFLGIFPSNPKLPKVFRLSSTNELFFK